MKGRFPTEEDMKGIEHKLPFMSKFDILVEVCRIASELYDQENKSNEGNVKAFDVEKSWGKRPVRGDHDQENKSNESSNVKAFDVEKSWGKRAVRGDHDQENKSNKSSNFMAFDVEKSWGKRAVSGDHDQENKSNESSNFKAFFDVEKSWGKRAVRGDHDQESSKTVWLSSRSRICCISGEELFKRGLKRVEGESSSGFRGNAGRSGSGLDRGKKRKYYGCEDFENYEKKERVLGKKRTYCGPKDEDFEYSVERKKARKNNFRVRARVVEAAPLPGDFAAEILRLGGNDVKLLIQKNITATDLNASENRFSIPVNQLREEGKDFLTEDEKITLDRRNAGNGIVPIPVRVLEPNLKRSFINFKKWPMNNSFCYVLCGSWTVMQKNNRLQANTELQVWSFRVNGELNLALVKVPKI